MDQISPIAIVNQRMPTSLVLRDVLARVPNSHFTLGWFAATLQDRSFGIVIMLLGLLAMVPVGSSIPGLLIAAMAGQMIVGRTTLPRFVASKPLPSGYLLRVGWRVIPALAKIETLIHPRWPGIFDGAQRSVAPVILLLAFILLLFPVPLSNAIPGLLIALISLAHIEEDGLFLLLALVAAVILIGIGAVAAWAAVLGILMLGTI